MVEQGAYARVLQSVKLTVFPDHFIFEFTYLIVLKQLLIQHIKYTRLMELDFYIMCPLFSIID